ncbi:gliding motility-associated ABC transporter ATP-binding subunit GldA [Belliella kenyensis]|uniref:Gliding motility-associated ABC transporter ATP-binding subunit GldA n=1 Tax=Belliella kenyensis TaxID=1472724 RepID=A0ABV8EPZ3_9BACT|nr:gliding motility-associated ABC transporter ATP-binding subunit GldA [Belliella kenyensis]MCH7403773.1 gliding motility-associated ABC transporter ATP-binding subunit GldA [Belliella kenyensis]MDN3602443.1 gliding motility-associated ABC transporter ATP-binding subunit GldA [Belliella kenyensis]
MSLQVQNLTKTYANQNALDQVSFEAEKGQVLGFLGPNGAGKSTTMKIATGFLLPDAGDVLVNGVSVLKFPNKVSKLIGYLPEHNPLYLDMYVREFLGFVAGMYGMKRNFTKQRIEELVAMCGLEVEVHKKIGQLSKGYRQRVGLAKALIHDPEVIILDEPTTGLDPNQLVEIRALIKQVAKNKTMILSTHIMQEVEAICDQVVIINKGKIVASDNLSNLKSLSQQKVLLLETEEDVELSWFIEIGKVSYPSTAKNIVLVQVEDIQSSRKSLLNLIDQKGLNLVSIQQKEQNLEAIFQQLTQNK